MIAELPTGLIRRSPKGVWPAMMHVPIGLPSCRPTTIRSGVSCATVGMLKSKNSALSKTHYVLLREISTPLTFSFLKGLDRNRNGSFIGDPLEKFPRLLVQLVEVWCRIHWVLHFGFQRFDPALEGYIFGLKTSVVLCKFDYFRLKLSNIRLKFRVTLLEYRFKRRFGYSFQWLHPSRLRV